MTPTAGLASSGGSRPVPFAGFRPPLADGRFWLIQCLVAGIAVLHGAVEWAESRDGLVGVAGGIHDFPVPANIVPVVLAGIWFGMRGGVATGLTTMVLSTPNLVLFHMDEYAWLGEVLMNVIVVGVGLAIGSVVERNTHLRREAEANAERLRTLWDVAAVLALQEEDVDVVSHVVEQLAATRGISAVAFIPESFDSDVAAAVAGDDATVLRRRISVGSDGRSVVGADTAAFDVATSSRQFGTLVVACSSPPHCAEDRLLYSLIANELGSALETLAHRQAEKAHLLGYARAVTAAQERERRRIARDLHDGPTQSMIVINRALTRLGGTGSGNDSAVVGELRELVQDTLGAIQRTTQALRPLLLDDLGLVPALRSLAERRALHSGLVIPVEVVGEPRRLDDDVEVAAYRIAQEALTNVERHAAAQRAEMRIEFTEDGFTMEIRDDGIGMAEGGGLEADHFGLLGMRERADLVGGELSIDSEPGRGTGVRFEMSGESPEAPLVTAGRSDETSVAGIGADPVLPS